MKTQINNFLTNKLSLIKKSFYAPSFEVFYTPSFEVRNMLIENGLPVFQDDNERRDFERILSDKELAKEMFPPSYFVLVE